MKSELKAKFLHYLSQKNKDQGFTLIELLVVIIIIGVLSAVALPNLLGQVGKARETEAKQAVGTVNRAQQGFHFENQNFTTVESNLGVSITTGDYLNGLNIGSTDTDIVATVAPNNTDAAADGTRAYSGGIFFDSSAGTYTSILCQSPDAATGLAVPTSGTACASGATQVN